MKFTITAISMATLLTLLSAGPLPAHEGHDHGAPPPPVSATIAPRGEAASDAFELVVIAEGGTLVIYLDRFATNEPIEGATIEVETPDGPVTATPRAGDAYRLKAPWLAKPDRHDLIVTVTAEGVVDVLPVTLEIPQTRSGLGLFSAGGEARAFPLGFVIAATFGGFALGAVAVGLAWRKRRQATALLLIASAAVLAGQAHAHEGEDHSAPKTAPPAAASKLGSPAATPSTTSRDLAQRFPDGSVFVPKMAQRILAIRTLPAALSVFRRTVELPGRIIPDPNASGLVQASVGGRLSPPPGGFPRLGMRVAKGDVLAYVTPPLQAIDVSDMRQRQGELDQQIAIVERRVARYEPLAASGAVARVQLDEARLELQGLRDRRAALDRARREPEALIAPVDGIVADGSVVAGQIAPSNMVVFHIVDPAKLWIEALAFSALGGANSATARTAEGRTLTLSYRGSGFADRNQSVPIHFAIDGETSGLRVGQFLLVLAGTEEENKGMAVPRSAVVRNANGQDIVYEHVAAEGFQPRAVRIEPLDGERVLIATGISPGARVVTQGAELLDQVR
jgi:cobalt-zinc-cadmium efflux system membrane fusion protein